MGADDGDSSVARARAGADEPTQVDARAEPSPAVVSTDDEATETSAPSADASTQLPSGVTGATGTLLTRSAPSGVTTASPLILRSEEQARAVALFRLVIAAGIAAVVAVWLPERVSPGRWLATVTSGFTVLVTLWLLREFKDPARFDPQKLLFQGLCCVGSILAVVYYVGIFSPTIIAMYIGVYFFGVSDSTRSGWAIYLSGALGYLALTLGAMLGLLPTNQSVLALSTPELPAMLAVTLVTQVLFAATFWMARRSRQATLMAFERLERAARQIKKREALLNEARAELDQERAAKEGRFSDQELGKYSIGELIGRGAMGEVYRAFPRGEQRAVAVKFLNAGMSDDQAAVERFFREVEIASRMRSPHVVRVMDHGTAEGRVPFLVMELLEGADLAQILREKKRLGVAEALELVREVASALGEADEAGVVHRDLKPQNLFRAQEGSRRVWKVLDFGVSKILETGKDLTLGAAVGTPSYMSPEQARGEPVDHRADVFALGVVAYRVLTGRPAFTGPDSPSTLYNVVHVQPARPSDLARLAPDVDRALALALAKRKDRRFASSLMFATALSEAARGRLDERLRRDADLLLAEHPWGADVLTLPKSDAARRTSDPPPASLRARMRSLSK